MNERTTERMNECFELPEDFNIYHAEDTLAALKTWLQLQQLAPGADITLSGARVAEIDGTALQMFAALRRSGYCLHIVEPSRKLLDACQTTGLGAWLAEGELP